MSAGRPPAAPHPPGERPRWAHRRGSNPWVAARLEAEREAARAAASREAVGDITGEVPVVVRHDDLVVPDDDVVPDDLVVPDDDVVATAGRAVRCAAPARPDGAGGPGRDPAAPEDRPGDRAPTAAAAADATGARLVRSSAVVAVGTLLSRVTGLGRVAALTFAVGARDVADAFNLANTTPNIVYELLLGGVLSATLVPIFVDRFRRGDDEAVSAVVSTATVVLLGITAAAVLAAPLIFDLFTSQRDPVEAEVLARLGVPLLLLLLPQMVFYGWTALGTAVLNAKRRFAVPAYAPVLNNLVSSASLVALGLRLDGDPTVDRVVDDGVALALLGGGTTLGIVAMTLPMWPAMRRAGVRVRFRPSLRHPAVREVIRRAGWTLGYVAANTIGLAVVLALAAATPGTASAYNYAAIFFQLPHGLVAVSVMTTVVPELATAWHDRDAVAFRTRFGAGLRLVGTAIVPAAVALAVLAAPLVAVLLERGAFDAGAVDATADVLVALAVGLPGFSAYLYALRGFYAMGDTRTPFLLNAGQNAVQVGVTAVLLSVLDSPERAIGVAYAASYSAAAVSALVVLHRRVGGVLVATLGDFVGRAAVATAVMVAVVVGLRSVLGDLGDGIVGLVVVVLAGGGAYAAAAMAVRLPEVRDLIGVVARRRRPAQPRT